MGTSTSSKGPPANVPFVPPWVEDVPSDGTAPPPDGTPMAPPRRFQPARAALGRFGGGGGRRDLQRGLGHYSRSGMGGAQTAARRMAGSAASAGALYQALSALAAGEPLPLEFGIAAEAFDGKTQIECIDALVDALRPTDGTQDTEAARDSAARALAEVLVADAGFGEIGPEQIERVVQAFLGNELAHRIELDVGAAIIAKAASPAAGLDRLQEMKAYVREEMTRRYAERRALHGELNRQTVSAIGHEAIRDTFDVFESYL